MSLSDGMLSVGQPFAAGITSYPSGRFELRHWEGNLLMQICMANISDEELHAFHNGAIFQALYVEKNIIFFCFKIDGFMEWSDVSFSGHLVAKEDNPGKLSDGTGYFPVPWVLIDAGTGLIKGMRMATFSPRLAQSFQRHLTKQMSEPFSEMQYQRDVREVYSRLRKSRDIAAAAFIRERAGVNQVMS